MIQPGLQDALERWLTELRSVAGRSEKTIDAYRTDVLGFLGFLQGYEANGLGTAHLGKITTRTMRAWMAHERDRGLAARSLARALSAVKNFITWMAEKDGFDPTAVLMTRAPRFRAKLPRPLEESAAKTVLETIEFQSSTPWVALRDQAVVTLLYGCGLRISEALALTGADLPLGETLRILGKGKKERVVPVVPAARQAVAAYARACPFDIEGDDPLFRGVRGKALNPRHIQKVMEQVRMQLGLPASATPHAMRHSFRNPSVERGR